MLFEEFAARLTRNRNLSEVTEVSDCPAVASVRVVPAIVLAVVELNAAYAPATLLILVYAEV